MFMLDANGNVVTWNAGAQRLKGYRAEEIGGRHFSVFFPAEDVAAGKPERALAIAAAVGRLVEDEGWRVRQNGTQFWAERRRADELRRALMQLSEQLEACKLAERAYRIDAGYPFLSC